MKALILAAGYGTRLYPLTEDLSKPLLEINNKPIISYILEKLDRIVDLKEVFVVTNNRFHSELEEWTRASQKNFKNIIIKAFNDGTNSPDDRLGAVGDINFIIAKGILNDEDLLVIGGDNFFDFRLEDFVNFAKKNYPHATVGLFDIKDKKQATKFGVLSIDKDNKIISFEEKPKIAKSSLIAMCLYCFPKETLGLISEYTKETGTRDTTGGYISWLYKKMPVYGFIFKGIWEDVGSFESLCRLDKHYCKFIKEVNK